MGIEDNGTGRLKRGYTGWRISPFFLDYLELHGIKTAVRLAMVQRFKNSSPGLSRECIASLLKGNQGHFETALRLAKEIISIFHLPVDRLELLQEGEESDLVDDQEILAKLPAILWPQNTPANFLLQFEQLFKLAGVIPGPDGPRHKAPEPSYSNVLGVVIDIGARPFPRMDERDAMCIAQRLNNILSNIRNDGRLNDAGNPTIRNDSNSEVVQLSHFHPCIIRLPPPVENYRGLPVEKCRTVPVELCTTLGFQTSV